MAQSTLFNQGLGVWNEFAQNLRDRAENERRREIEIQKMNMLKSQQEQESQQMQKLGESFGEAAGKSPILPQEQANYLRQGVSAGKVSPEFAFKQLKPSFDDMIGDLIQKAVFGTPEEKQANLKLVSELSKLKMVDDVFKIQETQKAITERQLTVDKTKNARKDDDKNVIESSKPKSLKVPISKSQFDVVRKKIKKFNDENDTWFSPQEISEEDIGAEFRKNVGDLKQESKAKQRLFEIKQDILDVIKSNIGESTYTALSKERKNELATTIFQSVYTSRSYPGDGIQVDFKYSPQSDIDPAAFGIDGSQFTEQERDMFESILPYSEKSPIRTSMIRALQKNHPIKKNIAIKE